jgi:LmbE family N-acetylglucosaminyl deacetylase
VTPSRDRSRRSRGDRPAVTIVSPHYDDAPLSLGQSLLDGALSTCRVRVEVVFGRSNFTRWFHPTRGRALPVSAWRRAEEALAQAAFGYRVGTASWEEVVLRTGELDADVLLDADAAVDEDLVSELATWMRRLRGSGAVLLVPAGIGDHLDHRLVAEAGRRLAAEHPDRIGFYEDRPYASIVGADVLAARVGSLRDDLVPVDVSGPVSDRLHRLLRRCYPSQVDDLFVGAMAADRGAGARERVWFAASEVPPWLQLDGSP